jgi:hypothetical protein
MSRICRRGATPATSDVRKSLGIARVIAAQPGSPVTGWDGTGAKKGLPRLAALSTELSDLIICQSQMLSDPREIEIRLARDFPFSVYHHIFPAGLTVIPPVATYLTSWTYEGVAMPR